MAKITAIVNDLIFMSRIRSAAETVGTTVEFIQNKNQLDHFLDDCELLLVDLENDFMEPVIMIEGLKKNPTTASIKTVGYFSHTNTPLKARALSAGCNEVLSRFEFNSNLKEILQTHLSKL